MPALRRPRSARAYGGEDGRRRAPAAEEDATLATPAMVRRPTTTRGLAPSSSWALLAVVALILPVATQTAAAASAQQAPEQAASSLPREEDAATAPPASAQRGLNALRDLPQTYGMYRPGWLNADYEQGYAQAPSLPSWVDPAQAGTTRPGWTKYLYEYAVAERGEMMPPMLQYGPDDLVAVSAWINQACPSSVCRSADRSFVPDPDAEARKEAAHRAYRAAATGGGISSMASQQNTGATFLHHGLDHFGWYYLLARAATGAGSGQLLKIHTDISDPMYQVLRNANGKWSRDSLRAGSAVPPGSTVFNGLRFGTDEHMRNSLRSQMYAGQYVFGAVQALSPFPASRQRYRTYYTAPRQLQVQVDSPPQPQQPQPQPPQQAVPPAEAGTPGFGGAPPAAGGLQEAQQQQQQQQLEEEEEKMGARSWGRGRGRARRRRRSKQRRKRERAAARAAHHHHEHRNHTAGDNADHHHQQHEHAAHNQTKVEARRERRRQKRAERRRQKKSALKKQGLLLPQPAAAATTTTTMSSGDKGLLLPGGKALVHKKLTMKEALARLAQQQVLEPVVPPGPINHVVPAKTPQRFKPIVPAYYHGQTYYPPKPRRNVPIVLGTPKHLHPKLAAHFGLGPHYDDYEHSGLCDNYCPGRRRHLLEDEAHKWTYVYMGHGAAEADKGMLGGHLHKKKQPMPKITKLVPIDRPAEYYHPPGHTIYKPVHRVYKPPEQPSVFVIVPRKKKHPWLAKLHGAHPLWGQ